MILSGKERQPFIFPSLVIPQESLPAGHPRHGGSRVRIGGLDIYIHRPDEISSTKISLGRRVRKGRREYLLYICR